MVLAVAHNKWMSLLLVIDFKTLISVDLKLFFVVQFPSLISSSSFIFRSPSHSAFPTIHLSTFAARQTYRFYVKAHFPCPSDSIAFRIILHKKCQRMIWLLSFLFRPHLMRTLSPEKKKKTKTTTNPSRVCQLFSHQSIINIHNDSN